MQILTAGEPPCFRILQPLSPVPAVLACDHAENRIPRRYGDYGLSAEDRQRHIAWDPGAAALTEALVRRLGWAAILHRYSRLILDPNRIPGTPEQMPAESDGTAVPGNAALTQAERVAREQALFYPYQRALAGMLAARDQADQPARLIAIHSFTPLWQGQRRIWEIGLLHDPDRNRVGRQILEGLAGSGRVLGDNQPYSLAEPRGFTLHAHGLDLGRPAAGLEIRQDLLETADQVEAMADLLAPVLAALVV